MTIDTDGLMKLLEGATEAGDWSTDENTIWSNERRVPVADVCIGTPVWYKGPPLPYQANAALICAAVNALPALLERVKRYEAALKKIDAGHLPDLEGKPDVLDYAIATRVFYMKLARAALNQEGGQ